MTKPRITFGMIVLNGEPFIRYNLRALYPFAHEIIVVEGAVPHAAAVATVDGHSTDGTLHTLREFQRDEDPEQKMIIVTAEDEGYPNGFWPGEKHEQSQAYAKRATGNWLWQVDIDEFYRAQDIVWIRDHVLIHSDISAVSLMQFQFWGGLDSVVDSWYLRYLGGSTFHRIFRWAPGYNYITHRPPTVVNQAEVNLRHLGWYKPALLARQGIYLYHYSFIFPHQVLGKVTYYSRWTGHPEMIEWKSKNFDRISNPYRVYHLYKYPSWLNRFSGAHPDQVVSMIKDLKESNPGLFRTSTSDIDQLLNDPKYAIGKKFIQLVGWFYCTALKLWLNFVKCLPLHVRQSIKALIHRSQSL